MKTNNHILTLSLILMVSLGLKAQQFSRKHVKVAYDEVAASSQSKKNFTFKNLRLYPIKASKTFLRDTKNMGKYTPLKEALKSKKVSITEQSAPSNNPNRRQVRTRRRLRRNRVNTDRNIDTSRSTSNTPQRIVNNQYQVQQRNVSGGGSASVNNLFIENTSKDTLYIMAGEIVQGGKQDRVIAKDMVIPPNSGKINLSVFCVEKGRWRYKKSKNRDNFDGYYGVSSLALRKVVDTKKKQGEVWKEVERSNGKNKVSSGTSAYTEQKKNTKFKGEYSQYLAFFKDKFKGKSDVIGVIVATGNKVVGCDMFASPQLFQTQYKNLLGSYINEAITDGAPVKVQETQVEQFMTELLDKELKNEQELKKRGKVFKNNGRKLHVSKY
ncbi:hypothetical protein BKI52_02415 [marine bacterium AO1-C]|nr:hypothetical protein BKI52_02415 [marine bacterium AO1-C]